MSNDISTSSSYLDSIRWQEQQVATSDNESDALTQEDFFSLLTQQLSYQDPSNPADNDQMIAQMTSLRWRKGLQI